jgi:hypothetical protein
VRRGQRRGRVRAGIDLALEDGLDQVRTLRKVPVQRSDSDAGQVRDLFRWRVHACAEDRLRRLKQGVDVALGVGSQPPRCAFG